MSDLRGRLRKLEKEIKPVEAGLFAKLIRLFMREGSMPAVVESYERDTGRPLIASPDLLRRAEQGALRITSTLVEMDEATDGTAWRRLHERD
jgi:hypothetical protein